MSDNTQVVLVPIPRNIPDAQGRPRHRPTIRREINVVETDPDHISPREADLALGLVPPGENPDSYTYLVGHVVADHADLNDLRSGRRTSRVGSIVHYSLSADGFVGSTTGIRPVGSVEDHATYAGGGLSLSTRISVARQLLDFETVSRLAFGISTNETRPFFELDGIFRLHVPWSRHLLTHNHELLTPYLEAGYSLIFGNGPNASDSIALGYLVGGGVTLFRVGHFSTSVGARIVRGTSDLSFDMVGLSFNLPIYY